MTPGRVHTSTRVSLEISNSEVPAMAVVKVVVVAFVLVVAFFVATASAAAASPAPHVSPAPGYWLVGADGGVFAFNAPFESSGAPGSGSPGLCPFAFGPTINISAVSLANSGQVVSERNCVGIAGSGDSSGYWIANSTSLPSAFGSATAPGQSGCSRLNGAAVGG